MKSLSEMIADLEKKRDELHLQLHLGTKEAEDEWGKLIGEWEEFLTAAQFEKSKDEVGEAAKELGLKMKDAYDRFKKAVD